MALFKLNTAASGGQANVARALERWKSAMEYYENIKDPDLIEFAIYDMEAARRRYIFLLKQSKQE